MPRIKEVRLMENYPGLFYVTFYKQDGSIYERYIDQNSPSMIRVCKVLAAKSTKMRRHLSDGFQNKTNRFYSGF